MGDQEEWEVHMRQKVADDQEMYLEKERLRLGRMRDAEIEKTIHLLQTENLVFEKKCRKDFDERMVKAKVELEEVKMTVQKVSEVVRMIYTTSALCWLDKW